MGIYPLTLAVLISIVGWTSPKEVIVGPCVMVMEEPGDCPDPKYIQIYLFTRKNKNKGQYIEISKTTDNITSSNFNPEHPNRLIIHGYNADMNMYALVDIKAEYFRQEETNIWVVNYPRLAEGAVCYPFAVHNIRHVGDCLAQLVRAIRRHSSSHMHVVGFSLGAQVANYIAVKLGNDKLDRITGLDPAGPLFTTRGKQHRLDASDAKFVDVVHTNGLIQGDIERCGHIDFYMNGGVSQPGCLNHSNPFACDHHRAPEYFAESIRTQTGFLGWQCDGYLEYITGECHPKLQLVPMGEHCPPQNSGFYVTYTASEKPFALGNWTDDTYKARAPKASFTNGKPKKKKQPVNDQVFLNQQSELINRIFPSVERVR